MPKNTELEALLNFDPIAVAEELTGERRTDAMAVEIAELLRKHVASAI